MCISLFCGIIYARKTSKSPFVFFRKAIIYRLLVPAVSYANLFYILLHMRCYGAFTVSVKVIHGMAEMPFQRIADALPLLSWHLVIKLGHADSHFAFLAALEQSTPALVRIERVDCRNRRLFFRHIVFQNPSETLFVFLTLIVVTQKIVFCVFCKKFFLCHFLSLIVWECKGTDFLLNIV